MKIIKCCVINTSFNEDIGKAVKHKYILIHGINPIAFPQEVFLLFFGDHAASLLFCGHSQVS